LRRFSVLQAPRLDRDVEKHVAHLRTLEDAGKIRTGYVESWFSAFEETLAGLRTLAERHPYAPERQAWGRDVRNALFADYRILYLVVGEHVWAMRVRHQRQAQLKRAGPGTAYPPPR
jgi:plasmid stabilization system protein ParE